jgi:MoxR-like ATPase
MLLRAAQARAVLEGRQFVVPDDVQAMAAPVISHRIALRSASASTLDAAMIIGELVGQIEVPV